MYDHKHPTVDFLQGGRMIQVNNVYAFNYLCAELAQENTYDLRLAK